MYHVIAYHSIGSNDTIPSWTTMDIKFMMKARQYSVDCRVCTVDGLIAKDSRAHFLKNKAGYTAT